MIMIPSLNQIILILAFGTPLLLIFMALPAMLELKRPRDSGPMLIMERVPIYYVSSSIAAIGNIEEEAKFDFSPVPSLRKILEVLPSLEV
jgi:hypothetical protein